jgi:hypothetical protein
MVPPLNRTPPIVVGFPLSFSASIAVAALTRRLESGRFQRQQRARSGSAWAALEDFAVLAWRSLPHVIHRRLYAKRNLSVEAISVSSLC